MALLRAVQGFRRGWKEKSMDRGGRGVEKKLSLHEGGGRTVCRAVEVVSEALTTKALCYWSTERWCRCWDLVAVSR